MPSSIQPDDPAPSELLKYLPEHGVVICTSCHYAVQPQAISRHLKELHRLLRSRRRKFDQYVEGLWLRQPQDVVPPTDARQFPVPFIPVESGLRCEARGCGHLCVSSKRMQAHWREDHRCKGDPSVDWRPAPLQTFFRGNILRYFTCPEALVDLNRTSLLPVNHNPLLSPENAFLLDHYFQQTYRTFVTGPETEHIWLRVIPDIATQHDFLLHGLLACTALHLSHLNRHDHVLKKKYAIRGCALQEIALPSFRAAIDDPNEHNCHAILGMAYILVVYSFASTHCYDPLSESDSTGTDLFLIDNSPRDQESKAILPTWLYFLRGGCSMICDVWDQIQQGPFSALMQAWEIDLEGPDERDPVLLSRLLAVIPTTPTSSPGGSDTTDKDYKLWSEDIIAVYSQAAIQLSRSFAYLHRTQSTITTWDVLRVWPMEVSMEYMNLLHDEHPGALILLAHYSILLKYMEKYWYFESRAKSLMLGIQKRLGHRWGPFIQEAMDTVLGLQAEA
ncbi:hypothetical protein BJX99DRAFT_237959 [Aspergillus californicus]